MDRNWSDRERERESAREREREGEGERESSLLRRQDTSTDARELGVETATPRGAKRGGAGGSRSVGGGGDSLDTEGGDDEPPARPERLHLSLRPAWMPATSPCLNSLAGVSSFLF
jgi:hypothetical protein